MSISYETPVPGPSPEALEELRSLYGLAFKGTWKAWLNSNQPPYWDVDHGPEDPRDRYSVLEHADEHTAKLIAAMHTHLPWLIAAADGTWKETIYDSFAAIDKWRLRVELDAHKWWACIDERTGGDHWNIVFSGFYQDREAAKLACVEWVDIERANRLDPSGERLT